MRLNLKHWLGEEVPGAEAGFSISGLDEAFPLAVKLSH
jgi:hypothetical protein